MRRNSANDRVQSFVWWPDVDEDVLKRFSIPNYLQFGPNWVKNGHRTQELQKLECFEEDDQEFSERPRLEPRVVSG